MASVHVASMVAIRTRVNVPISQRHIGHEPDASQPAPADSNEWPRETQGREKTERPRQSRVGTRSLSGCGSWTCSGMPRLRRTGVYPLTDRSDAAGGGRPLPPLLGTVPS